MSDIAKLARVPESTVSRALRDNPLVNWVYAEVYGLILAFLGSDGRNAATIFSLRNCSSR